MKQPIEIQTTFYDDTDSISFASRFKGFFSDDDDFLIYEDLPSCKLFVLDLTNQQPALFSFDTRYDADSFIFALSKDMGRKPNVAYSYNNTTRGFIL